MCANLKSAGIVQPFILTGKDALLLCIVCHTLPIFSWLFFVDSESDNTRDRTGCYLSHRTKLEPVKPPGQTLEKSSGDWMRDPAWVCCDESSWSGHISHWSVRQLFIWWCWPSLLLVNIWTINVWPLVHNDPMQWVGLGAILICSCFGCSLLCNQNTPYIGPLQRQLPNIWVQGLFCERYQLVAPLIFPCVGCKFRKFGKYRSMPPIIISGGCDSSLNGFRE